MPLYEVLFLTCSIFVHVEFMFLWISKYPHTMYWIDILLLQWFEILPLSCTNSKHSWFCDQIFYTVLQLTKYSYFHTNKFNGSQNYSHFQEAGKRAHRVKGFTWSPVTTLMALDLETHFFIFISWSSIFFLILLQTMTWNQQKVRYIYPLLCWLFFSNRRSV